MKVNVMMVALIFIALTGCFDGSGYEDFDVASDQVVAIPLVNSKTSIGSLVESADAANTTLSIDENGRLTIFYSGEVVRNNAREVFPAYPGILDNVLPDTNTLLPLPFDPKYKIHKGVFGQTKMFFRFRSTEPDNFRVKVTIPNLKKDNIVWSKEYMLNYIGQDPIEFFTELSDMKGWTITPEDNHIRFIYEAYNSDNERIKFDYAAMKVDVLVFDYVEGYFSNQVFDIKGSDIEVGLFDAWVSGGMDFANPKMNISVENGFGFPVRSRVNKIILTKLGGEEFNLESEFVDKGFDFAYPTINEVGQVKSSGFAFNNSNSNLRELFNDKVVKVTYDIDAVANPDDDTTIVNFVDVSSYFSVNVDMEVPLLGRASQFTLKQNSEIDLSALQDVRNAQFKAITGNEFPTDIRIQMFFKDQQGSILDSLFANGALLIPAAPLGPDLKTLENVESVVYEDFDDERLARVLQAKDVEIRVSLDNGNQSGQHLWIYDDYEINFRLGALIQIK